MSSIHFRTGLESIKRSPFQALAAVSVLALTFFVMTILAVLVYSSNQVLKYFETRPQVIAFLKDEAKADEVTALQERLKGDMRVKDVKFVSKEEALEIYKKATSDNPLLGELVSPSIFPASIEFSLTDLKYADEVINQTKGELVVDSVGFTANLGGESSLGDVLTRLKSITQVIRIGGGVLVGVLALSSFLVILVIVGMRIITRKGEIDTLNLMGATQGFIRAPIMWEMVTYGIVGVAIGWVTALIVVLYITPPAISYFGDIPILPKNTLMFFALLGSILAGELIIGLGITLWGSLVAVSRAKSHYK